MSHDILERPHRRHNSYSSDALEYIPAELFFEIAKYVDVDLLALRQVKLAYTSICSQSRLNSCLQRLLNSFMRFNLPTRSGSLWLKV
jgi:hypothetical protein